MAEKVAALRGADLIAAERRRQKDDEGYSFRHDIGHHGGDRRDLEAAANCYLLMDYSPATPEQWPWGPEFWKPKDRLSNLIRAGALLLAQIDVDHWAITCDHMQDGRSYLLAEAAQREIDRVKGILARIVAEVDRLVSS
jgi:hypothetical protein